MITLLEKNVKGIGKNNSRKKPKKHRHKPWVTGKLLNLCKKKNELFKIFIQNRTARNEEIYKKMKMKVKKALVDAEQYYHQKRLEESKHNMKRYWSVLNDAIGKPRRKQAGSKYFLDETGKSFTDSKEIANEFNNFFTKVGKNLAAKIIKPKEMYTKYMKENCATSIFLQPTDEIEIRKVIMKCEGKTSTDINGISMKLIKRIAPKIIVPWSELDMEV